MDQPWLQALITIEKQDMYYRLHHPTISLNRELERREI